MQITTPLFMQITEYKTNITNEELYNLPLQSFPGNIIRISTPEEIEFHAESIKTNAILGFDTESKPSFKKGIKNKVSLLQLSNEKTAYLIRLSAMKDNPILKEILESEKIVKIGLAIHDDIKSLQQILKFKPAGFIELKNISSNAGIECSGLKKLCGIVLGFRISKSQQISNWSSEKLTEAQELYAATDAWVCHQLYNVLNKQ